MKRSVQPEWLDELLANDPQAIASRRDLHRLNRIMGHADILCDLLESSASKKAPKRIMELGAGDGTFMLGVAQRLARRWPAVELVLLDCKDAVTDATRRGYETLGWKLEVVAADVFDFLKKAATGPTDVITANLFLHQFSTEQLQLMLRLAAERTRVFAACEPRRAGLPLLFSRLVGFIGCNAVTRYDAPLSVRAGFVQQEISALWPAHGNWSLCERPARLFTHAFLAERNADA